MLPPEILVRPGGGMGTHTPKDKIKVTAGLVLPEKGEIVTGFLPGQNANCFFRKAPYRVRSSQKTAESKNRLTRNGKLGELELDYQTNRMAKKTTRRLFREEAAAPFFLPALGWGDMGR